MLGLLPAAITPGLAQGRDAETVIVGGLVLVGIVFAVHSAVHWFMILA
jgi:hypothetical protein